MSVSEDASFVGKEEEEEVVVGEEESRRSLASEAAESHSSEPPSDKDKTTLSFFPDSTDWNNDIKRIILSEEHQEQLECLANKHVFVDKPWTAVRTQKVLENIETFGKKSPFRKLASKFLAYKEPEVLMGYNGLEGETNEYLICVTALGREVILKHLKQLSAIFYERMLSADIRKPRPWMSLGSEKEVGFDVTKNNRPLLTFDWVGDVLKRYEELNLTSVSAGSTAFSYTSLKPNPENLEIFDHVSSNVIDEEVQAGPKMVTQEVQTSIGIPVNVSTMVSAEIQGEELKDVINGPTDEAPIKAMFDRYIDKLTHMLSYNNEFDLYIDDYEHLHQAGKLWSINPLMKYKPYVTFSDAVSVKGLYITGTSWHPNLTGVVAVSYGKDVIAQEKVISSDSDDPDYVPSKKDNVIDQMFEQMKEVPEEKSKTYAEWKRNLEKVMKVYTEEEDLSTWEEGMRYLNFLEHTKRIRKKEIHLYLEEERRSAPGEGDLYVPEAPIYNVFIPPDQVEKKEKKKKKKKRRKRRKAEGSREASEEEVKEKEEAPQERDKEDDMGKEKSEEANVSDVTMENERLEHAANERLEQETNEHSHSNLETEGETTNVSQSEAEGTQGEEEGSDDSESDQEDELGEEGPKERSHSMEFFIKDVKLEQPAIGLSDIPAISQVNITSTTYLHFPLIWGTSNDWKFGEKLRGVAEEIHQHYYLEAIEEVGKLSELPSHDLVKLLFPTPKKNVEGVCSCIDEGSQQSEGCEEEKCRSGYEQDDCDKSNSSINKKSFQEPYKPPYSPLHEYYIQLKQGKDSDSEPDSDSSESSGDDEWDSLTMQESQPEDEDEASKLKFVAYGENDGDSESDSDTISFDEVSSSENEELNDQIKESFGLMNPVLIWSLADDFAPQLKLDSPFEILSVAFCPHNGNYIVGGSASGQVVLWDLTNQLNIRKRSERKSTKKREPDSVEPLMKWQKDIRFKDRLKYTVISYKPESHHDKIRHIQWVHPLLQFTSTGNIAEITDPTNYSLQVLSLGMDGVVKMWDLRSKPRPKMFAKNSLRPKSSAPPRPPKLLEGISPFYRLDKRWLPFYWIKIADRRVKPEKVTTIAFDNRVTNYTMADPTMTDMKVKMNDTIPYKYVPTPVSLMDMDAFYGNLMGEVGYIKWSGFVEEEPQQQQPPGAEQKEKKPSNWEMVQAISRFEQFHDGAVTQVARHPLFPHIALSAGGHSFCLWHTGDLTSPIKWKRYEGLIKVTALSWSPLRPSLFRISRSDGYVEIWDLLLQSHAPKVLISIGKFTITALSSHILPLPKGILGVADVKGTLNFFYIPWVYQTWQPSELEMLEDMFDREPERRRRLKKWREDWAKFHFPKGAKESSKRSDFFITKKKKKQHRGNSVEVGRDKCARIRNEVFKWYLMRRGATAQWLDEAEKKWFSQQQENLIQVIYQNKHWDKESLDKAMGPLLEVEEKEKKKQEKINTLLDQADDLFLHNLRQIFSSDASVKTMSMISMRIAQRQEIDFSKAIDEIKTYFGSDYEEFDNALKERIQTNFLPNWQSPMGIFKKYQVSSDLFHEFSRPSTDETKLWGVKKLADGILKKHNLYLTDVVDRKEIYFEECLRPSVGTLTELKEKYGTCIYREFGWYMMDEATQEEKEAFLEGADDDSEYELPEQEAEDANFTEAMIRRMKEEDPDECSCMASHGLREGKRKETVEGLRREETPTEIEETNVEGQKEETSTEKVEEQEKVEQSEKEDTRTPLEKARDKLSQKQLQYISTLNAQLVSAEESEISKYTITSDLFMSEESSSDLDSIPSKEHKSDNELKSDDNEQKPEAHDSTDKDDEDSSGFKPDTSMMNIFPERKESQHSEEEEEEESRPLSKECSEVALRVRKESIARPSIRLHAAKTASLRVDHTAETHTDDKETPTLEKPTKEEPTPEIYVLDPDEVSLSSVSLPYSDTSPTDASDMSDSEVEKLNESMQPLLKHINWKEICQDSPDVSEIRRELSEEEEEPTEEVLPGQPQFVVMEDEEGAVEEEEREVEAQLPPQQLNKNQREGEESEEGDDGEESDGEQQEQSGQIQDEE